MNKKLVKNRIPVHTVVYLVIISLSINLLILSPNVFLGSVKGSPDIPMVGAMVYAFGHQGYGYALTDASGKYTITEGLKAGVYNVSVIFVGYLNEEKSEVSVTVGQETKNINFNLRLSGRISGKVSDAASGQPIPNVMITSFTSDGKFGWPATTDSSGNYLMDTNLVTGTYNVSSFMAEGYTMKTISNVKVTEGKETTNVNLALDRSGIISGKITASGTGQPLKDATVSAFSEDGKSFGFAQTDAGGNYKITTGLGTGDYTVMASYQSAFAMKQDVKVVKGQETKNVDLSLTVTPSPPSGTIKGKVTDTGNTPISGASVSASGPSGSGSDVTDGNGEYEISEGLGTGSYKVHVSAAGYLEQEKSGVSVTVNQVTSNVNFQLSRVPPEQSGSISGVVYGPVNPYAAKASSTISCSASSSSVKLGESITVSGSISPAVAGATVTLTYTKGSSTTPRTTTSGADGKYSDKYVPSEAGSWSVVASWAGDSVYNGASSSSVQFVVSAAPPPGSLKITVKDKDGKPIDGASVASTSQPAGQSSLSGTTGSDGSVTFSGVKAGSYGFQITKSGYAKGTGTVTAVDGQTSELTITLQAEQAGGGGGIPGFPYESIVLGLILGAIIIWIIQHRR